MSDNAGASFSINPGGDPTSGETRYFALFTYSSKWVGAHPSVVRDSDRYLTLSEHYRGDVEGANSGLTQEEDFERLTILYALTQNLVSLLRKGTIFARGFRLGTMEIVQPPAEWWANVAIDLDQNSATGHGSTLTGMRVFHPQARRVVDGGATGAPLPSSATRNRPGRPNAENTSIRIFDQRRAAGIPRAASQMEEAAQILDEWPTGGPPAPKVATISGHISRLWQSPDKSPYKLPDKL